MMSRCKVICICTTLERGQSSVAKFHNRDSLKFMVFHLLGPLGAPPHARSLRGSQTIVLPPPASSSPNHAAQIPESSHVGVEAAGVPSMSGHSVSALRAGISVLKHHPRTSPFPILRFLLGMHRKHQKYQWGVGGCWRVGKGIVGGGGVSRV